MNAVTTTDKMDQAIHDAESLFEQAAIARAEAENADERRKQTKAVMFLKFKDEGDKVSATEAEQRALASPEYRAAADDWMTANITWRRLEGKSRGTELRFEAWRTRNATERAKMNLR